MFNDFSPNKPWTLSWRVGWKTTFIKNRVCSRSKCYYSRCFGRLSILMDSTSWNVIRCYQILYLINPVLAKHGWNNVEICIYSAFLIRARPNSKDLSALVYLGSILPVRMKSRDCDRDINIYYLTINNINNVGIFTILATYMTSQHGNILMVTARYIMYQQWWIYDFIYQHISTIMILTYSHFHLA